MQEGRQDSRDSKLPMSPFSATDSGSVGAVVVEGVEDDDLKKGPGWDTECFQGWMGMLHRCS